ncbi:MAG: TonB-dependent receptor [Candidatus Eremiobacteraeota bacterium]|nr:TonB-dependent receptor [Candidatus Eremiobacteraeota bacterium]
MHVQFVRMLSAIFSILLFAAPALAANVTASTATIQGVVRAGGAPVAAATVRISGAATVSTTTDANGVFSASVPPGVYRVDVSKAGYSPAVLNDLAVVGDSTVPVTVALNQADLTSLQTIGRVSTATRGSGSAINTGTAASNFVGAQEFSNLANSQINNVLERLPDVTIQHMGSQPDTTIIVGGVQPYETQVLIDGHPIALGQYGVWLSQYFPSYLIGGVETQSGPGNTTPFANLAVGGTANLLTPGFTNRTVDEFVTGYDNYQSQYSHFLGSGAFGKLQYVVGAGIDGQNGPYFGTTKCLVTPDNFGANENRPSATGIIQTCTDASGSFFNKGEVLKLRYNFSPATSFEAGFVGAWGGYNPQGTAWGTSLGATTIVPCLTSDPNKCTNPNFAYLTGSQVPGYGWYTGSSVYNNQTLFDAQFRTSIGNNTLLVRPYVGVIEPEIILGTGQTSFPNFFSPLGATPTNSNPANPNDPYTNFVADCSANYGTPTNPAGGVTVVNNRTECYGGPYTTFEQDKLYGSTFSFLHPIGDSLLNFTYDFHGQSTFAYIDNPNFVSVPFSTDRYSTFSLTGDLHLVRNLGIDIGLYDTTWKINGVQRANPASLTDTSLTGLSRSITRFDPHLALVFRPVGSLAYRASYGTSATFPSIGQVSGLATYQTPAGSLGPPFQFGGTLTEKNPNLVPEVAIEEGLGIDKRFRNGAVVSLDLQNTVVHNVFEELTSAVQAPTGLEGIFLPINAARLSTQLATLKYRYAPRFGFGYNAQVAAEKSVVNGLTANLYSPGAPSFPVNNVQICGNGVAAPGIPTCIPYLKGYGQVTYVWRDGTYAGLGINYQGKNNAYFQPPFALLDFTFRRPITKMLELQVGVENLLNTNTYNQYLAMPNLGTPLTAATTDTNFSSVQQTSFTPTLVSAPPRIVRLQLRLHSGR